MAPDEQSALLARLSLEAREFIERMAEEASTEEVDGVFEKLKRLLESAPAQLVGLWESQLQRAGDWDGVEDLADAALAEIPVWMDSQRVKAGDRDAFDRLWPAIRPGILSVIRGRIARKQQNDVDEVESDVLGILWARRDRYDPNKGFYLPWAHQIARNQARWRRQKVRATPGGGREESYVERPPSACFAELLGLVSEEKPHIAFAFLYNRYLGWMPARIVTAYWNTPLEILPDQLIQDTTNAFPELEGVAGLLAGLSSQARAMAGRTLADYCVPGKTPQESVSQWSGQVAESLSRRVVSSGAALLRTICELPAGSFERLAFLWWRLLREPAQSFAAMAEQLLRAILDRFRDRYRPMSGLTKHQIGVATAPLERQIMPARRLMECSRGDLLSEIVLWRERVQAMLADCLSGRGTVALAYVCGALPGVQGRERSGAGSARKRRSDEHLGKTPVTR